MAALLSINAVMGRKNGSQTLLAGSQANKENRMHPVEVGAQVLYVTANAGSMCVCYIGNDSAVPGWDGFFPRFSHAMDWLDSATSFGPYISLSQAHP